MFDVNKLQVAKPCHVGWETMSGDERSRHCSQCQLNVYNIAGMTAADARNLIEAREGRVCIRLVRRADGTVLTKDCPVGIRKYRSRAARFAGAALATILGVFSVSYGQKNDGESADKPRNGILRTKTTGEKGEIYGIVSDSNGVAIGGIELILSREGEEKKVKTKTDNDGKFVFVKIAAGVYKVETGKKNLGFTKTIVENINVLTGDRIQLNMELMVKQMDVVVGIYGEEPLIDTRSSTVETVITADKIRRIP